MAQKGDLTAADLEFYSEITKNKSAFIPKWYKNKYTPSAIIIQKHWRSYKNK
jgi:hypothetical protein